MLAGDFERKIRRLNKELRIFCGNSPTSPAGVYHVVRGEYTGICGVDKNYLTEHTIKREDGAILRSGWRRVIKILIKKGFIDRHKAEKVFGSRLPYFVPPKKVRRKKLLGQVLPRSI